MLNPKSSNTPRLATAPSIGYGHAKIDLTSLGHGSPDFNPLKIHVELAAVPVLQDEHAAVIRRFILPANAPGSIASVAAISRTKRAPQRS